MHSEIIMIEILQFCNNCVTLTCKLISTWGACFMSFQYGSCLCREITCFFYVFKSIKFWIYVIQSIMLILLFIFLLAVMWHDSYLPFSNQRFEAVKKYTKMTKYLLGFILLFVEVFCYNYWGLYIANIFTSW